MGGWGGMGGGDRGDLFSAINMMCVEVYDT